MSHAIGALAIAAAGAWLAAAILGLGATRRIGLVSSAALSGLGGAAAVACGVLLAVHGAGPTLTFGAGPVGGASFHLAPLGGAVHRAARPGRRRDRALLPPLPRARSGDGGLPRGLQPRAAGVAGGADRRQRGRVPGRLGNDGAALLPGHPAPPHPHRRRRGRVPVHRAERDRVSDDRARVCDPGHPDRLARSRDDRRPLGPRTRGLALGRLCACAVRLWLQGRTRAVPHLAARRPSRRAGRRVGLPVRPRDQARRVRDRVVRVHAAAGRTRLVGAGDDGLRRDLGRARDPLRADGTRPQAVPGLLEHREHRDHRHRARRRHDVHRLWPTRDRRVPADRRAVPHDQPRHLQDPACSSRPA